MTDEQFKTVLHGLEGLGVIIDGLRDEMGRRFDYLAAELKGTRERVEVVAVEQTRAAEYMKHLTGHVETIARHVDSLEIDSIEQRAALRRLTLSREVGKQ